jgi:adhesin transport system outer membrane protein
MLFDGFSTRNEVARLGFEKLASYYDFQQTAEDIALEVVQAYHDVIRYRDLVNLAKENYIQHRLVFDDIQERVSSGLGRRVDLEQATGRLALAESNLLTERTNLHDVTMRFHRLVGKAPAVLLETVDLPVDLVPESRLDALERAYQNSPQLSAAIERIRAVRAEMKRKNSAMMPRLDLRLRQELDHDTGGEIGRFDEQAVELVLSYNLYNGGSDSASKRQSYELMNQAMALRDKACRDVRQELLIAHNDIAAQQQQVEYLDRNQQAIGKARQAYRKQFDIGQRTLLDLLDTENEYFETRRTLVNAETDLTLAKARTLEAMGLLLKAFSLRPEVLSQMEAFELFDNDDRKALQGRCEITAPDQQQIDNEQLLSELFEDPRFRKNEAGKAAFNLDVKFAYDSSLVPDGEDQRLREAAEFLQKYPHLSGVIEGHTDYVGSEAYNKDLSQRRADSVLRYLVDRLGISPSRLQAVGYGEERPMATNETEEGRSLNRRVELVLETEVPARKPRLSDFTDFSYDEERDELETSGSTHEGWKY